MRLKNIYNNLYRLMRELNGINDALFILHMDGETMYLYDTKRGVILFPHSCDEIESFMMCISKLKHALYYVKNVNPMFYDSYRLNQYVKQLNHYYHGKRKA